MEKLSSFFELKLLGRHVACDCRKVGINQRIRISLTTFAGVTTVVEARSEEHLPDLWVSPVVWLRLWPDLDPEIIVTSFKESGHRVVAVPI